MRHEVKTFSDIDHTIDEIRYWLDHGDYDKMYSDRGRVLERARDLMTPAYVHLWMIMYPLEGQEYTRSKNISDLSTWLYQIISRIKNKVNLHNVYVGLDGNYLQYVRGELHNHHGYPSLVGKLGDEVSNAMSVIFSKIEIDIFNNKKVDKNYQITKQMIQDIIKYVLDL